MEMFSDPIFSMITASFLVVSSVMILALTAVIGVVNFVMVSLFTAIFNINTKFALIIWFLSTLGITYMAIT